MKCNSQISEPFKLAIAAPCAAEAQYLGNHRNRTRFAVVSVMIFIVLKIANLRALLS
jgi:hypothetical protein